MPNFIIMSGRIINNTEKSQHNYMFHPATEEKKAFLRMAISCIKPGSKKGDNGYYPTDLWTVKAFGATAEMINNLWGPNKTVCISGELTMSDEYTSPTDGTVYPPRPEIIANSVWRADTANSDGTVTTKSVTSKQTNARPAAVNAPTQRKLPF
jgi:single-stranded DNA-binding protein